MERRNFFVKMDHSGRYRKSSVQPTSTVQCEGLHLWKLLFTNFRSNTAPAEQSKAISAPLAFSINSGVTRQGQSTAPTPNQVACRPRKLSSGAQMERQQAGSTLKPSIKLARLSTFAY